MRESRFFQNCGTFWFDLYWKYHNFERNEIRATVFLKWTDFRKVFFFIWHFLIFKIRKIGHHFITKCFKNWNYVHISITKNIVIHLCFIWVFFRKIQIIFNIENWKLTIIIRFWHFLTTHLKVRESHIKKNILELIFEHKPTPNRPLSLKVHHWGHAKPGHVKELKGWNGQIFADRSPDCRLVFLQLNITSRR